MGDFIFTAMVIVINGTLSMTAGAKFDPHGRRFPCACEAFSIDLHTHNIEQLKIT